MPSNTELGTTTGKKELVKGDSYFLLTINASGSNRNTSYTNGGSSWFSSSKSVQLSHAE